MTSDAERDAVPLGDPAAFARWVGPSLVLMRRLAARLSPQADPDDVVQDSLTRAWQRLETFDPDRGTPTAWLLAITADQSRAARRTRVRHLKVVDDTAELPDRAAPRTEAERDLDLELAVRKLADRQQLAVHLHYFVGLPVDEAAAVMGCAPGTVKSTLYDARTRLREILGDDDD